MSKKLFKSERDGAEPDGDKRRNVVKGLAVGVGGVSLSQWSKPVVETVVLPAHAQTTGGVRLTEPAQGGGSLNSSLI